MIESATWIHPKFRYSDLLCALLHGFRSPDPHWIPPIQGVFGERNLGRA